MHRFIIIKCSQVQFTVKLPIILGGMALFNFENFSTLKNGFCSISFEKISVLDQNFFAGI